MKDIIGGIIKYTAIIKINITLNFSNYCDVSYAPNHSKTFSIALKCYFTEFDFNIVAFMQSLAYTNGPSKKLIASTKITTILWCV